MRLQYGNVNLSVFSVDHLNREAVFVGQNYAYTRYRFQVRAYINRVTQNDVPNERAPSSHGEPGGLLTGGNAHGPSPALSDIGLRHDLLQPRQKLVWDFLGVKSLVCPLDGYSCDVLGGPKPISCNVEQVSPATWVITWACECAINETAQDSSSPVPLVLAQQFTMRHVVDDTFFTVRLLEGSVLFRLDALLSGGAGTVLQAGGAFQPGNPSISGPVVDDFRSAILAPPPLGFRRDQIEVWSDEETPALIHYRVLDREIPFGFGNPYVSKLIAQHTVHVTKMSNADAWIQNSGAMLGAASARYQQILNAPAVALKHTAGAITDVAKAAANLVTPWTAAGAAASSLAGSAVDAAVEGFNQFAIRQMNNSRANLGVAMTSMAMLPVAKHTVDVAVMGTNDPRATRDVLEGFARQIVSARLSTFFTPNPAETAYPNNAVHPLVGRALAVIGGDARKYGNEIVRDMNALLNEVDVSTIPYGVDFSVSHDLTGRGVHISYSCITGPKNYSSALLAFTTLSFEGMEDTFEGSTVLIGRTLPRPIPPSDNGTRGTYLEVVVAAALQAPNSLPPDLPAEITRPFRPKLPLTK